MPVNPFREEHLPAEGVMKPPRYTMPTEEPFRLYVKDVSRISGISPLTIRKWADAGWIPHIRLPNGWRKFRESDAYRLGGYKHARIKTSEEDQ